MTSLIQKTNPCGEFGKSASFLEETLKILKWSTSNLRESPKILEILTFLKIIQKNANNSSHFSRFKGSFS